MAVWVETFTKQDCTCELIIFILLWENNQGALFEASIF